MKIVRFLYEGNVVYGEVEKDLIVILNGTPFEGAARTTRTVSMKDIHMLAPCRPGKAVCIGLNYKDHAEECNIPLPEAPIVFMKASGCVIGPNETILYPEMSSRVDYEAELAIVIGKEAHKVSIEEAKNHILGYTCANDVTARDLQPEDGQWTVAKSFDTFLPLGPIISDEIDTEDCKITTRLNGAIVQSSNTSNLIFKPEYLVSYLSQIMTLYPEDVIITGTPAGIGPMYPKDVVEVEISGIGTLSNTIGQE
jgi:2-keto-4-pentenoate hydratase/2-oxohepta-3-ene-1,7-dioic acid hydratase in catechol pathway